MQCSNCNTINESGAKFCRECGHRLEAGNPAPRPSAPDEHVKVGELIYASYKYKEAGKLEDAALACQGALALSERNASAHALLGSVYELKGDIPAAIKEYEIVLSITPESVTDRQILERLKSLQAMNTSLRGAGLPGMPGASGWKSLARPYIPFAAAFAGFFLVLALGLFSLHHTGGKTASRGAEVPLQAAARTDAAQPALPTPAAGTAPAQAAVPPSAATLPGAGAPPAQPAAASAAQNTPVPMPAAAAIKSRGVPPVPVPKLPRSVLPLTGKTGTAEVRPVIVPSLPGALHKDSDDTPVITPVDEPVHKAPPSGSSIITPVITPDEPREKPAPAPVITPVTTPAPARTSRWVPRGSPEQQAVQYQKAGQYKEAISSWKQALGSGADSGRVQQQIGLCYQKLGQHAEAVESYKKAIGIYKEQQSQGRDQNDVQRNIRSCEAAIRISSP